MTETKEELLKKIKEDYNSYTAFEVQQFLIENKISESELLKAVDGDMEIVEAIKRYSNPILESNTNQIPDKIKDYCTEIFFWGLGSAGKTWALSGILSTIYIEGHFKSYGNTTSENCISPEYLNGLLNVINNRKPINYLPDKTTNDTIRYMNFKLLKDGKERKVAFIDLAGDVVKAIAKENIIKGHNDLKRERDLLENILNNKNRKIHFFFIDYNRDIDYDRAEKGNAVEHQQRNYFTNLCAIFNSKGYFKKNTDFIYIVITKADMMDCAENQRRNKAIKYFKDNYASFRNNLGKICQDNEINSDSDKNEGDYSFLDDYVRDFSIGDVLFLRMCRFKKKFSEEIVNIIFERVPEERTGIFSIFG